MKLLKKSTLATLVGAAALTAAGAANATIVVGGENGYEFSVDGNINQFFTYADSDNGGADNSEVANGLLPTFFGFNVAMPEINGLKVAARVSISPSTNNGSYVSSGSEMEQREAYATVDGSFGQIMLGKGLGLYAANNILLDQTLYGVGATTGQSGSTTLGRIGYGYDYANWRSQIRWTSNDMNGFKIAAAVMDADEQFISSTLIAERDPRFEASLSYATSFDNGSLKLWLDGMTQSVELTGGNDVDSEAVTVGGQVLFSGFEVVAAYYDNEGVGGFGGLAGLLGTADVGIDANGNERDGDGYYVQGGYNFAGNTWVKASYGESNLDRTSVDKASNASFAKERNMWTVGIYHDVTANLKLVAEYSEMETEFHGTAADQDTDAFSVGGFISW